MIIQNNISFLLFSRKRIDDDDTGKEKGEREREKEGTSNFQGSNQKVVGL